MRALFVPIFTIIFTAVLAAQSGSVRNAAGTGSGAAIPITRFVSGIFELPGPPMLAPNSRAIIDYFPNGTAPAVVTADVSLRPFGTQTAIPARVLAADGSTITFVVPPTAPLGPAQLIYKASGDVTKWIEVAIVPSSFAIFTNTTNGAPVAQFIAPGQPAKPLTLSTPVRPGQDAVIWGSGLGAPRAAIGLTLGGVKQQVLYVGGPLEDTGVDQINFAVAPNTPVGCYVPLAVTWGPNNTTWSYLSISSDGGPCRHPFHLGAADLARLDAAGTLDVATVGFSSATTIAASDHASRAEGASAWFQQWSGNAIANMLDAPVLTGCQTSASASVFASFIFGFLPNSLGAITLNKGPIQLNLNGLNNYRQTIPARDTSLAGLPPSYFGPADWSLYFVPPAPPPSGGGPNPLPMAAISAVAPNLTFSLTTPVMLTAASTPIQLSRAADQTISWNGPALDPHAQAVLTIDSPGGQALTCFAPASAGSLTIPKDQLAPFASGAASVQLNVRQSYADSPNILFTGYNGGNAVLLVNQTSSDTRPAVLQ
ncbi:MAG: hypothetical protein KGN84_19865 [Acidobacteriota bacterium]|nr:hypothetical protein [Acidobacteriota bacterium]